MVKYYEADKYAALLESDCRLGGVSTVCSEATYAKAKSCARGGYQLELVRGQANWSGAGMAKGARAWSASYARSRANLIERWEQAGLIVRRVIAAKGRIVYAVMTQSEAERVDAILSGSGHIATGSVDGLEVAA